MTVVRRAESEAELEVWTRIRNVVERDEPTTLDDLRDNLRRHPEARYWLAAGGEDVGCCFANLSSVPGRVFVLPRVVPAARGRGAGTALLDAALAYARELGGERARSSVDGADDLALAFAARRGFEEVDRQVELVRPLRPGETAVVEAPRGIVLEELPAARVPELRELVSRGVEDMPVAGGLDDGFAGELLEEFERSLFRVVAREEGRPVGVAGLLPYGARTDALEHAFTTVLRSHRGLGIAQALKAECVRWGAAHGYGELVTWTQTGNDAMQAVNVAAGFRPGHVSITVERALP
jgi:GNAT superfamily N-acetyltransferase